VDTVDHYSF